jgi:hypothetical protein
MKKMLLTVLFVASQANAMEQGNASNKPYKTLSPALNSGQTFEGIRSQGLDDAQTGLLLAPNTHSIARQAIYIDRRPVNIKPTDILHESDFHIGGNRGISSTDVEWSTRERTPRGEFYALTASFPEDMRNYARAHFEQTDSHGYDVTMEEARALAKMYYKQLGIPFPETKEVSEEEKTHLRDERLDALPSINKILQELKEAREKSDDKK